MIHRLIDKLMDRGNFNDLLSVAHDYRDVVQEQKDIITRLNEKIELERLEHARNVRDLLEKFLICFDHPEIDVREPILTGIADLSDEIARREEHIVG